jgi:lactoylglutathione lyase
MEMPFCWTTIHVSDMEQSLHFYRDLLGLPVDREMQPEPGMKIAFLGSGDTKVELICRADQAEVTFGQDISLGFTVPSIDTFAARLVEYAVSVETGPIQPNPYIRFIYVRDPDGVTIQLVEQIQPD